MNSMEVFTYDDSVFTRLQRDNVHDLHVNIMPHKLGVASQQRHVYLIMDIAYAVTMLILFRLQIHFFIVFQTTWAVFFDET